MSAHGIASQLKHSSNQANTKEYEILLKSLECSKSVLSHVDQRVKECENLQKLSDLQRRLDTKPIENSAHPVLAEYKVADRGFYRRPVLETDVVNINITRYERPSNELLIIKIMTASARYTVWPFDDLTQKLDLRRHKMVYDGPLTWRICKTKQLEMHAVLLEDILVLLQKSQDSEKLVLRLLFLVGLQDLML